jgi:hypothetical protein
VFFGDAGRAEDRDSVVDVAQRVEATVDLGLDPFEAKLVLLLKVAGLAQQLPVAPRPLRARAAEGLLVSSRSRSAPGGIRTRAARLKRPPL